MGILGRGCPQLADAAVVCIGGDGHAGEHPSSLLVARPRLGFAFWLGGVQFDRGPGAPGMALGGGMGTGTCAAGMVSSQQLWCVTCVAGSVRL